MSKKIIKDKGNIRVIYPENHFSLPKDCPVCKLTFRDSEDVKSFKEWKCCTDCRDSYAYHNKDKWLKGWRPKIKNLT